MECGPYATLSQAECHNFKKIKSLFQSITSATPAELQNMTGQERFPISTPSGLRTLTLAQYAQAISGGGGGGGVPSHSIAEHNNVVGNPQNGDVLTYNNGNWQPSAPGGSGGWGLQGNTLADTDFIGSTNGKPIRMNINSDEIAYFGDANLVIGKYAAPNVRNNDYLSSTVIGKYAGQNLGYTSVVTLLGDSALKGADNKEILTADNIHADYYYTIVSTGDTDFTLIGALDNNPGTLFLATGTGTGTGTVSLYFRGSGSTAVGVGTMIGFIHGVYNTSLGYGSLQQLEWGSYNISIGSSSGGMLYEGDKNIFIGSGTVSNGITADNQIVIGSDVTSIGSNSVIIGNDNITKTRLKGTLLLGTNTEQASSILTMSSTSQGFLPPRMTTTQKIAIAAPDDGLVVYDTTLNKLCVRANGAWETITSVP